MLTLYRRHLKSCEHREEGRNYRRCKCPVWVDGFLGSHDLRQSLKTRNWEKASDQIHEWEARGSVQESQGGDEPITIAHACTEFLRDARARELREPTLYKYRLLFRRLQEFTLERGLRYVAELDLEMLRAFRASWPDHNLAALKKLERLRAFFRFVQDAGWTTDNPRVGSKIPRSPTAPHCPFRGSRSATFWQRAVSILIAAMRRGCVR